MNQPQIAERLEAIATLMELKGENPFKIKAFTSGARLVETLEADLAELVAAGSLRSIKGIGPALAEVITELVTTGQSTVYTELKADTPEGLIEMLTVPGLGPKKIKAIYEGLGITTVGELEYACNENRLAGLAGFGAKTQDKILAGIQLMKQSRGKFLCSEALGVAEELLKALQGHPAVQRSAIAGSLRRAKETVKDADLIASSDEAEAVMAFFVSLPQVKEVVAHGPTKSSVRLENGLSIDLRVVRDADYPFTLHHFTGSKEHNTLMRQRALSRGLKLNEYGLWRGEERIECRDEEEIFKALDLAYVPPELREGMGELELAEARTLPELVSQGDLAGIFHVHTTFSDGAGTLEQMVKAAQALGYRYIGISDHSQAAAYAHGLTPERIAEQHAEIDRLNQALTGIRILKGIEADILADGSVDYDPEVLARFDFVIASIHSRFGMDKEAMTERIVRALRNPYVTILGHMTGRLLLSREPYELDLERIFREAAEHGVAIELNANPHRLDLDWRYMRRALELGVTIAINPDAHSVSGLQHVRYGVGIARKGGVPAERVLNSLDAEALAERLAARRERAMAEAQ
ncbi:MAG TPA: DNA polymerase/3'-5' exonuclease PolX [Stenomitos sp.]